MPTYEFKTDDGEIVELFMPFAEHDRRVKNGVIKLDDGRKAVSYFNPGSGISTVPANYPMVSSAAGVHPAQIKEQMDHLRKKGCGEVEHNKDGDVIFQDSRQRKKVCEALGLFDRNGGYGDPSSTHRTANVRRYR
jgi:hypothetical protein